MMRVHGVSRRFIFTILFGAGAWMSMPPASPLSAQVRPVYSRGTAGLIEALQRVRTTASAMHTGAHPDDEDTALIARLARGDHARTAYLALNRGEGGQNVIGLELFDALGVLRTEELLQARALDGGDQFFTRAFDFGFTRTMEEAASRWDERRILGDMVRAIRVYRPLVVLARFTGTPADGHGQHQLAGKLTPLAVKAAGDPREFPEQIAEGLRPWAPKKLYVGQGFRSLPGNEPTIQLPTGVFDPVLGRTFAEIAMEGRSQHKSQEMGTIERRGPQTSGLRLVSGPSRTDGRAEQSVFDGLDTSLTGLPALAGLPAGALDQSLGRAAQAVSAALHDLDPLQPLGILPRVTTALAEVRGARRQTRELAAPDAARAEADFLLGVKEAQITDVLLRASGLEIDVLTDRESAAPGESARVSVNAYVPDGSPIAIDSVTLRVPASWRTEPAAAESADASENPLARFFRETPTRSSAFRVTVGAAAPFSQPYWLATPRTRDVFDWGGAPIESLPFAPPDIVAVVSLRVGDAAITLERGAEYRYADSVRGEIRRSFDVVPAVTVAFDERLHIVSTSALATPHRVAVRLQSQTLSSASGTVRLTVPAGWAIEPREAPFTLNARGERAVVSFTVTPPRGTASGAWPLGAEAVAAGQIYKTAMRIIDYPHIQRHRLYEPTAAVARVLDLKVAPVKVGYVMGSGDQVPDAIRRMGLEVTLIDEEQLTAGDLSHFDTIVVGVRASESRPGFVTSNARLLQYVRDGGTLIVQYQQTDYPARKLTPFPAAGNSRVTDERAAVKILQPQHPAFTFPNRITDDDFSGWVQERNLYAFATFDPQYTPLLETQDPGEPPQQSGELYARLGKGHYVYTSYAWFRQLPAGVPGAYRLFANLLALSKAGAGGSR
jgi:LmbE family N-acetylglucosaminyl deacetylase